MALEFSPETLKSLDEIVRRYPQKEAAMLPVLRLAQEEFGYLSSEAVAYVARLMELRGFTRVSHYRVLGGLMAIHHGHKPSPNLQ